MDRKIAIIDLGSNSVRLLIMCLYSDGSYKVVDQAKEMVRLSENMGEEMTLKKPAIKRTINALKLFQRIIEAHSAKTTMAIATAAVRRAKNQSEFIKMVKELTGLNLKVISGQEEAYFDYLAVINTIAINDCTIVDVGGASTEIILVKDRQVQEMISLPFGSVLLAERFSNCGEYSSQQLNELRTFLSSQLEAVNWLSQAAELTVIGLGGIARTLAKIDKRKKSYPLDSLHNYCLTFDDVTQVETMVTTTLLKDRAEIPGLDKERADIFPAGACVIKMLMSLTCSDRVLISGNGLREGIFFKYFMASGDHEHGVVRNVLMHSVLNLLQNFEMNLRHCYHVQKLALALFDQTKELHGMDCSYRKVLSVGALLHDIGEYVNYYNHHKHGFYLTLNSRVSGLTNKELLMCAFIVAMHTNEDIKQHWEGYKLLLDKSDYKTIKKLSLFVRIAEQLDRSEFGIVEDIKCNLTGDSVQINIVTAEKPELEISEAVKSCQHFEKLLKTKMFIVKAN